MREFLDRERNMCMHSVDRTPLKLSRFAEWLYPGTAFNRSLHNSCIWPIQRSGKIVTALVFKFDNILVNSQGAKKNVILICKAEGASAPFAYAEALELFQCHTIRSSLVHGNRLDNVVRVSIGGRDHFDLFFFNPHISLATVKV
ncbi:Uncharacterized protein Fot_35116 [Forsythia ovata]|uniref:Uncharacterized protein n=1 Tax=Forsythia ovata TaxID=205694 RepID=A0ABD1SLP7_9LAMI